MDIRVQDAAFDLGAETAEFADNTSKSGAVVTFTGIVRNNAAGTLDHMLIEHYPEMTLKALEAIAQEALARWSLEDTKVIHRFGIMRPGDMIMMVATASPHRKDAFEAAEFLMDYLKSRAPFWKKEISRGDESWVAAKEEDEAALGRWR